MTDAFKELEFFPILGLRFGLRNSGDEDPRDLDVDLKHPEFLAGNSVVFGGGGGTSSGSLATSIVASFEATKDCMVRATFFLTNSPLD